MDINEKTIVITGAGQGLGQTMALALARKGARLALADLAPEMLDDTARLCGQAGAEVLSHGVNVADEASVVRFFDEVMQGFERVDAVISNAGTNADALLVKRGNDEILKMKLDDFNKVLAVDLTGVFLCAREAAARMIGQGNGGVIVSVSSIAQAGNVGQSNYSAAKAGVSAMTVAWAQELAKHGIRAAAIAPGFCETRMVARMRPDLQDRIRQRIPAGRFGKPEEIAHSVVYILENDYFNGRVLEVDGGLRL